MKTLLLVICCLSSFITSPLCSQSITLDKNSVNAVNVVVAFKNLSGKQALNVVKDSTIKENDEAPFARINGTNLKDGIIEVKVLSRLLKDAAEFCPGIHWHCLPDQWQQFAIRKLLPASR